MLGRLEVMEHRGNEYDAFAQPRYLAQGKLAAEQRELYVDFAGVQVDRDKGSAQCNGETKYVQSYLPAANT